MYVVGYPKSGNTWLCFLLAYCLNAEYDDLDAPGIHPTNDYQRQYVKGGFDRPSYQNQTGKILKTHRQDLEEISLEDPVVYLVRDGRDVMVSYYFFKNTYFYARNLPFWKRFLFQIRKSLKISSNSKSNYRDFSAFLQQYTPEWITHISIWLERKPTAIIRYEDLKADPEATLNKLFAQLNVTVASEIIQEALFIFDFKQLSQRKEGEEDRTSFFRKGIVGDWQNHFSRGDLNFFQQQAAKVMSRLGYD
ncbi:sulfotransferase domain-containing protein [Waterburya agarophytonicola K14]|uniref:Sulfotransferase domain-containing protein n=1 Tax=Waterburya agarophytonicola KI4 TaxID=2874699 RepID=A0A964FFG8_9CYAN|nr:sulfotransferase domain-containing protein [Waterburya agarophytonicola]MCC0177745.1 sulfotransferase domain-containing protein [Waterburya agarophytonicola KI4]